MNVFHDEPQKTWKSRPFTKEQLPDVLALRSEIFLDSSFNSRRWEWEYEENPQGEYFVQLALDRSSSKRIAGHYAVISYKVLMNNREVHACQSLDTFTNPAFRNQGIFVGLAEETFKKTRESGVKFIFGFPNSNSFPGFVKKLNFHSPFSMHHFVRPLRLGYFLKTLPILKSFLGLRNIQIPMKKVSPGYEFKMISGLPSDWLSLQHNFEKNFGNHTRRTQAYMEWRFLNCPDRSYCFLEMRKEGELLGVAVLCLKNKAAILADFVPFAKGVYAKALLEGSLLEARKLGAENIVSYLQPKHPLENLFRSNGFRSRGAGSPFILRAIADDGLPEDCARPENWYLMAGDTDYY